MIYTQETDPRLPDWLNRLLNVPPFCLPVEWCYPLLMVSCGFKERPAPDNPWRWVLARVQVFGRDLFWNSAFSLSIGFPFCIGLQIRWSANDSPSYLQAIIGWKPNGRFALTFRILDDESASAGYNSPNPGLATGWIGGVK